MQAELGNSLFPLPVFYLNDNSLTRDYAMTSISTSKICTKCGIEKSLEEFYKSKYGKYNRTSECKACVKIYARERNAKPEVKARNSANTKALRATDKGKSDSKAARRRYEESEAGKATRKRYAKSKEGRITDKKYKQSKHGRAAIKKYKQSKQGKAAIQRYAKTAKAKYAQHKKLAKRRGILFLLTFNQWYLIWRDSGHYEDRGKRTGQYCMARHKDEGPYSTDNVTIKLATENTSEGHTFRKNKK